MIWLKAVTLTAGLLGIDSVSTHETVVPGKMIDCVKYLDHLAANPDEGKVTRAEPNTLMVETKLGLTTFIVVRQCVEIK